MTPIDVLLYLSVEPGLTVPELGRALGIPYNKCYLYARMLRMAGLVTVSRLYVRGPRNELSLSALGRTLVSR